MRDTQTLVRGMTRWDMTAVAINGIVGAGIFGLPSAAAAMLGAASPIGFAVCAVIVSTFVLCFAEAASRFTTTGGPYLYSRTAFGPFAGFEVGWATWLGRVSAFGANSNLLVSYLGTFAPSLTVGWGRALVLIALPLVLAVINVRGVKAGARFGTVLAVLKIGGLALFAAVGLAFVDWSVFSPPAVSTELRWGAALLLLIYPYTGFEGTVIPAAEARNPQRDVAWGLISGLIICTVIYVAVQIVAVGTVPGLAQSQRPLADSASLFLGPIAGVLISILVCVSVIGNLSSIALVIPRITYAFAERGDFPPIFARLHPVYRTPAFSIVFSIVIGAALALTGTFVWLATVSVVARLVGYAMTCLAVPFLRKQQGEALFRLPLGPVIPVTGTLLGAWLLTQAAPRDLLAFVIAAVVGGVLFLSGQKLRIAERNDVLLKKRIPD